MKSKNRKFEKTAVALCATVLSLLLLWTVVGAFFGTKPQNALDTYTVCDDKEYYSETTYYLTEAAYLNQGQNAASSSRSARLTASAYTDDGTEFVYAATKNVWVEETKTDGVITDSRRMKKCEIDELESQSAMLQSDDGTVDTSATELKGEETTSHYKLTLYTRVSYVPYTRLYLVKSKAMWEQKLVWAWETDTSAEEDKDDCLSITWGGGELEGRVVFDMAGNYYKGQELDAARSQSDSYSGYLWKFREKSGYLGSELEQCYVTINMIRPDKNFDMHTSVKTTYVHTWGSFKGEFSIEANSEPELAATLKISEATDSWQIQIDVPDIDY